LAQPPESVRGRIRLTEQGEVVSSRYDDEAIAHRHLEQLVNAVLLSSGRRPVYEKETEWAAIMEELSVAAYTQYRSLVEKPTFVRYFHEATPIDHVDQLNIGSRPARRKKTEAIFDLRAIPWVFAWTQSRVNLPSWYGVGTALTNWLTDQQTGVLNEERLSSLREIYATWPFFRTVLDNVQVGLGKADIAIAQLYASLTAEALQEEIFQDLAAEFERTRHVILTITGLKELLDNEQWLQRSIRLRNPYVDPLNYIQVALLRELRKEGPIENRSRLQEGVVLSVNGIAAGLQNVG
jgi:phosphoenolpyruvate carboxylase